MHFAFRLVLIEFTSKQAEIVLFLDVKTSIKFIWGKICYRVIVGDKIEYSSINYFYSLYFIIDINTTGPESVYFFSF